MASSDSQAAAETETKNGTATAEDPKPGAPKKVDGTSVKKVTEIRDKSKTETRNEAAKNKGGRPKGSKNKPKVQGGTVKVDAHPDPTPAQLQHWEAAIGQANQLLARAEVMFQLPPIPDPTGVNPPAAPLQLTKDEIKSGAHAFANLAACYADNETLQTWGPVAGVLVWGTMVAVPRIMLAAWIYQLRQENAKVEEGRTLTVHPGGAK